MNAATDYNFEAGITTLEPDQRAMWGFRAGARGTHTSRTIMLDDLSHLLEDVPEDGDRDRHVAAIVDQNCLGKRTAATRRLSLQRMSELYALDPRVTLFRAMRALWSRHESSRPLLALLLALARDPLLRATAGAVLTTPHGNEFARQSMKDALIDTIGGDRLNAATLDQVVRNASSSWTQSGHFSGRSRKFRQPVEPTAAATMFALLIGFAVGRRGQLLFGGPWAAVLDAAPDELVEAAVEAKRLGLLDLKMSGSMIDVSFRSPYVNPAGS